MYPYLRVAAAIRAARRQPPMGMFDVHVSQHRAWPMDTDIYGELNHGLMLTIFEMARWQMAVRMGIEPFLKKEKIGFAVAGLSVRYRRRIPVMAKYRIQSQFLGWDERFLYMDQTMWRGDECAHQMLLRAAFRSASGTVLPDDFVDRSGLGVTNKPLPDWVEAWLTAEKARPWPPEIGPVYDNASA